MTVPGWVNKSNQELQLLCDPLWKRLSQAEKAKFKDMKKSLNRREKEARLSHRIPQEVERIEFEGKRLSVTMAQVESPCFVWVIPVT